jgi:hypothetical protein
MDYYTKFTLGVFMKIVLEEHVYDEVNTVLAGDNKLHPRYNPKDQEHTRLDQEEWKVWMAIRSSNGGIREDDRIQLDLLKQSGIEWAASSCYTLYRKYPLKDRRTIWLRRMR